MFNVVQFRSSMCYTFVRRTGHRVCRMMVVLLGPRAYHGCVTVDSLIYLVGGFDGMDYFNSVRCFNPIDKEWLEVAPMNARRYNLHVSTRNSCSIFSGDVSNCSFVSTDSTSCHEFASQFGLAYLLYPKNTQEISRRPTLDHTWLLNEPATPVTIWSRLNRQLDVGAAVILSGDRFSQNSENQQVKTVTMRVYTFTA